MMIMAVQFLCSQSGARTKDGASLGMDARTYPKHENNYGRVATGLLDASNDS